MKPTFKQLFQICIAAFLLFLAIHYWEGAVALLGRVLGAASPLMFGGMIAYIVNLLLIRYEAWYFPKSQKSIVTKSRRAVCMLGAYLTLLAVILLIILLVLPQLTACVRLIVSELPRVFTDSIAWLNEMELLPDNLAETLSKIDWRSRIGQIMSVVTSGLGSVVDIVVTTVTSVFSGVVTSLLAIIFSVYLLASKETLTRQAKKLSKTLLPERIYASLAYLLSVLNASFRKFIVGQCTEAVILGVLCTLGMFIFRLPYATMIGALVAFTALIPVAGSYIGAIVGAFMILTVSPIRALGFLIFLVILQQLEGNLIYPKVVGSSIGLPGIWVLAAVTVGGGIAGIPGMLFGVPLTAALYRIVRERIHQKEELI